MKKITEFYLEPSKSQPNSMVLVAVTESGEKYIVSGDHWNPSVVQPYEHCFHTFDKGAAMP